MYPASRISVALVVGLLLTFIYWAIDRPTGTAAWITFSLFWLIVLALTVNLAVELLRLYRDRRATGKADLGRVRWVLGLSTLVALVAQLVSRDGNYAVSLTLFVLFWLLLLGFVAVAIRAIAVRRNDGAPIPVLAWIILLFLTELVLVGIVESDAAGIAITSAFLIALVGLVGLGLARWLKRRRTATSQ